MKESLYDTMTDELGNLDFQRSSGMSKRKEISSFVERLNAISEREEKALFSVQELFDIGRRCGVSVGSFDHIIETMNEQGYLIKKVCR